MLGGLSLDLKYFMDLVQKRTGLTFDATRENNLRQKVAEVIAQKGYRSRAELYATLLNDDESFQDFVNQLTVNETYFFREPQYLQLLTAHIVPEILARKKPGEKIKIISAGCSTGEEPYSIAISLLEKFGGDISRLFTIVGADINSNTLEKATEGTYGKLSFRSSDELVRSKYFSAGELGHYKLNPTVRDLVQFIRFNLLSDDYMKSFGMTDVAFYRNVSIYFDSPTQRKILTNLASVINDGGYVIFSSSETFSHQDIGALSLIERNGLFYYQKSIAVKDDRSEQSPLRVHDRVKQRGSNYKLDPDRFGKNTVPKVQKIHAGPGLINSGERKKINSSGGPGAELMNPGDLFQEALDCFRKKEHTRAFGLAERLQDFESYRGKAYLLGGCVLLNMDRVQEALELFNKALQLDDLDLEAHMLLGLTARNSGEIDKAIVSFNNALYVKNSCWMAYYFLAEIYLAQGNLKKGLGYYESLLKILTTTSLEVSRLTFFPISFQHEDLLHLCRRKISSIAEINHGL